MKCTNPGVSQRMGLEIEPETQVGNPQSHYREVQSSPDLRRGKATTSPEKDEAWMAGQTLPPHVR